MNRSTRHARRLTTIVNAWASLSPTKSFAGMTLENLKLALAPSVEARARLADAHEQAGEARVDRDNADRLTSMILDRVVAAGVADPEEGSDSALYQAMGYVRKSDRASGLARRAFVESEPPSASPAAKAA